MDCSLPGSSVHGIIQVRILERVAISFSRGSSHPRNWTRVSCIAGRYFTDWAMREKSVALHYFLARQSTSGSAFPNICLFPFQKIIFQSCSVTCLSMSISWGIMPISNSFHLDKQNLAVPVCFIFISRKWPSKKYTTLFLSCSNDNIYRWLSGKALIIHSSI